MNLRCNEQIRLSPVRLIDETGAQRGVVPTDEAMRMARDAGMDLVEVSPQERPPVCKIMDYGKHKYMAAKKQKQKHHEQKLKEIRLRPKTDAHDRQIKLQHARDFLERGDRVQFTMNFKGRERFHQDLGNESMAEIIK
ncbi:MAG TPA: translation initiation factor IF-3, partial [Phycisphaerae bacterium]|nr:translation initiation factor IF-3 [Phycisphaerae bacterium]